MTKAELLENNLSEVVAVVWSCVNSYVQDHHDREDCFQESMLQIWQSLHTFRSDCRITTFAHVIARNTCVGFNRKKLVNIGLSEEIEFSLSLADRSQAEQETINERADKLLKNFSKLLPIERELLRLKFGARLPMPVLSSALGMSYNTCNVRYNRIIKKLR